MSAPTHGSVTAKLLLGAAGEPPPAEEAAPPKIRAIAAVAGEVHIGPGRAPKSGVPTRSLSTAAGARPRGMFALQQYRHRPVSNQSLTLMLKRRQGAPRDAAPLFAFSAPAPDGVDADRERTRRALKAIALRRHARRRSRVPDWAACLYAAWACHRCGLMCLYEAGTGVVVLRARPGAALTDATPAPGAAVPGPAVLARERP